MASSSHSIPFGGPVSLPLLKFSFCTTATLHGKLAWKHFSDGANMYAVFDHVKKPDLGRSVSKKQILKLVRNGDLLEEIDLENLVYQVRLDEERFKSQQISDSDRYVVVLIQHPLVALRYQLSSGEVRRIQMNFRPESGYDVAVKVFRALGLPVNDKNISAYASQESNTRPLWNAQHISRYPNFSEESQMKTEFSQSQRGPYHAGPPDLGMIPTFDRPSSGPGTRNGNILPARPSGHFDNLESPDRGPFIARSSGLFPFPDMGERALTSYGYPLPSSSPPTRDSDRPATAPLTLTQLMPPRRELPFPTETSESIMNRRIERGDPGMEDIQGDLGSQHGPQKNKGRAKAKPGAQGTRPSSSRAKPRPSARKETANDHTISSPARPEPQSGTRSLRSSGTLAPRNQCTKRHTTDQVMTDASPTQTNIPKTKSTTTSKEQRTVPEQFRKDFENIPPEEYMTRLDHWIRRYKDLPAPTKPTAKPVLSAEKDQLAAYIAQPEEERLKVLDDMICGYLDDENFVELVEDVSKSWRRIGLGF